MKQILYSFLLYFFTILYFSNCHANNKIDFWRTQKKGANYFNKNPSDTWFPAAKKIGIQFARLATDKWKSEERDFLIGDADSFEKISFVDFTILKNVLDEAEK